MSISRTHSYSNKIFKAGEFSNGLKTIIQQFSPKSESLEFMFHQKLADGSQKINGKSTYTELEEICDLSSSRTSINGLFKDTNGDYCNFDIAGHSNHISINFSAPTGEKVSKFFNLVENELGLKETESTFKTNDKKKKLEQWKKLLEKEAKKEEDYNKSIEKRFQKLEKRLGEIEEAQRQNKLRCFLSFKFENPQTKTKALKVTQLLDLSDVEVITGEPYEPRKVSEKVKATLNQHLDFICLIVTSDGETMWTRDEINLAHSKGVPLVPLVEEGATFTPGMFGDHEEIRFPSAQIEEAFIKLLEAVNFIRSNPKQIEK
ncbi:hypothetical protein BMS3Abin16_00938 [archaeon BMS3Abin16]|nr:hypothetical protein BMS3Abin16_00938 [archaeon BMS3Abin16]HDY73493.1 hypothetical protein [Euryarchaeota archaeon]